MSDYMTVKEVMGQLKISRTTAYGHIRTGKLRVFRVGRLVRIKPSDLKQFIEGKPSKNISL